ncbi:MAG: hypothetical protein J1D89_08585 [Agathobacter sp.]|nr:hypothetical protein [Agathobacter sp.]
MSAMNMQQLINSMENTIKLQARASAEKRARRAEREQKEFEEKLMRAAASQMELDGLAAKKKGTDAAVRRDQLIGLMGGF